MPSAKGLAAPLLTLLLASLALAQKLDRAIVGCDAVQCPVVNDQPNCRVKNNIFLDIGLTRIPDVPSSLEGFSIVKGVNISLPGDSERYSSVYYLGTPQNVSLEEVHGCAVFFNDLGGIRFPQNSNGTCSDIIDPECIDAIQDLAASVLSYRYFDRICRDLGRELEDSNLSACRNFTGEGRGLGSVTSISLSNLTNIEGKDNATSDCWPILPKSANLAPLFYHSRGWDGGPFPETGYNELHRITPVLTLFTQKYNSPSVVNKTVGRMSCIKINSTWTGEFKAAAPQRAISMFAIVWALAAWAMML